MDDEGGTDHVESIGISKKQMKGYPRPVQQGVGPRAQRSKSFAASCWARRLPQTEGAVAVVPRPASNTIPARNADVKSTGCQKMYRYYGLNLWSENGFSSDIPEAGVRRARRGRERN
jgi:hypothetical protein